MGPSFPPEVARIRGGDGPAPARFLTPMPGDVATYGPAIAGTAALMGTPLMPWQVEAADREGAVHPSGRFVFPFVVKSVPRQAGKTTGTLAKSVHRCLYRPDQRVWYTAQTGKYARDKWGEMVDLIRAPGHPLRPLTLKPKRTNGDESLRFVNGSVFAPHPPTRDGLHGKQSDSNDVDEAWAHSATAGAALMQAITPTQATRPRRQTTVTSTMGDASSEWFHGLIDRAYEGDPGVCLVDYGAPEGTSADDLLTIAAYHPAFGYTLDMAALEDARAQLEAGEFLRAYGNLRTGAAERVIGPEVWARAEEADATSLAAPVFGVAVGPEGSHVAIVAGWHHLAGYVLVEVVDVRPGTAWAAPELVRLVREHRATLAGDRGGPAGPILDEFERLWRKANGSTSAKSPALAIARTDYAIACAEMRQRITEPEAPRWRWRPETPELVAAGHTLSAAVDVATRRLVGDGAWVWDRRGSAGSIATLEAATLAGWAASRAPRVIPKPFVWVPGT